MELKKTRFDQKYAIVVTAIIIVISVILIIVDLMTLDFSDNMRILGPGAFPLMLFGIVILLCIWYIIEIVTGKGSSAKLDKHIDMNKAKKALRLFFLIVIAIFLMNFIGYVLALMIFTFCEMKFLSEKKLKLYTILLCTFILPLSIYFIFGALNVSLPSPGWMPF